MINDKNWLSENKKKMVSSKSKHAKYRYTYTTSIYICWMSIFNQIDPQSILLQNTSIQTDTAAGASVAHIFLSRATASFQAENHDHCLHSGMCIFCIDIVFRIANPHCYSQSQRIVLKNGGYFGGKIREMGARNITL